MVRLGAFAVTAGAMTAGHVRESSCPGCPVEYQGLVANGLFFTILAIDLLPACIYLIGVRRWRTLVIWGSALVALSALPWMLSYLHESFMAVAFVGYPVLLIGCLVGVVRDIDAVFNRPAQ
ncbi:MAG: hypothetical protein WD178_03790 [Actinomycetota bacterium]